MSFLELEQGLDPAGGAVDFSVPEPGEIEAEVFPPPDQIDCVAQYGATKSPTVPVKVLFRPTERLFGISMPDVEAETPALDQMGESFAFKARMPPGRYDVYVAPDESAITADACSVVPQVFRI
jgi:hypothetical protein